MNVQIAKVLLTTEENGIHHDRAQGCDVGNSVLGSVLSLTHGVPRWLAEDCVQRAYAELCDAAEHPNASEHQQES